MNYIYGQMCQDVLNVDYTGIESSTARVIIDNNVRTISVDVTDISKLINSNILIPFFEAGQNIEINNLNGKINVSCSIPQGPQGPQGETGQNGTPFMLWNNNSFWAIDDSVVLPNFKRSDFSPIDFEIPDMPFIAMNKVGVLIQVNRQDDFNTTGLYEARTIGSLYGPTGARGAQGANGVGIENVTLTTEDSVTYTLMVTKTNGDELNAGSFELLQGPQGTPGLEALTCYYRPILQNQPEENTLLSLNIPTINFNRTPMEGDLFNLIGTYNNDNYIITAIVNSLSMAGENFIIQTTIKNSQLLYQPKVVKITTNGIPAEAMQGTLSTNEVNILKNSVDNYIMFNNDKYYLQSNNQQGGQLTYTNIQVGASTMNVRAITITLETNGWALSQININ